VLVNAKRKWRRWISIIDREILDEIRASKYIFDGYRSLVEANESIREPGDFHEWVLSNHGRSVLLQVRKLADRDNRVYSLRRLIDSIADNSSLVTRSGFIRSYPRHHRDHAEAAWQRYTGSASAASLPPSVPLEDIVLLEKMTANAVTMVDKHIAHLDRKRRVRISSWDDVYAILAKQVSLTAKYGDLLGRQIADDLDSFAIPRDWMSIFDRAWRVRDPVSRKRRLTKR
jgi:hypothetical protein